MNKQRKIKFIVAGSLAAVAGLALTSCGSKNSTKSVKNYTVSFDVNDPDTTDTITLDAIEAVTVKKGETVTLTDLTYEGYTFGGWYTDAALTKKFTSTTAVESDLTLYAKWTKNAANKVTVTFNTNGGSSVDPVEVNSGSTITQPNDPTLDGYDFDGWYIDAALTNSFDFSTPITTTTTLYAKWVAAAAAGIDIPEGYEEVTASLDMATVVAALGAGKTFADAAYTAGMFTIDANKDLETRSRGKTWTKKTYEGFDYVDKYDDVDGNSTWTSTYSIKLVQAAGVSFTASGSGNCRAYVQNGSGSAGDTVVLQIKDKTADTTTDLEFPAASNSNPMVQVSFDVVEGHEYQVLRRDSGTIDLYKIELDIAVEKAEVSGIEITSAGTSKFFAGTDFNTTGLSVNAVKANGASIAIDSADLTVDTSAVKMDTPGTYTIKVSYQGFEDSYDVNVYALEDMELGLNKIVKKSTNTAAGNGQYFNYTAQQVYELNDEFSDAGLTVIGYAGDNNYLERFTIDSKYVTVSEFDTTTAGPKEVTITLTLNGVEKSETITVYVVDTAVATVTDSSDAVVEANIYVDKNYTGTIGAQVEYGSIGKTCNTFTTIQQALDYLDMQDGLDAVRKNIYIATGTYREKLEITLPYVSFIGISGAENTIIEWDSVYGVSDEGGYSHTTDSTQTVAVRDTAVGAIFDGLTISNYYNSITAYANTSYAGNGERALAMLAQADQMIVQNCKLLGWQDTLELFTGRQYFKNSYISGCVDYIFGTNNTTLFEGCEIHTVKSKTSNTDDTKTTAYVTAFKGCNKGDTDAITYGAIFNDCDFTVSDDFVGKIAVGRCWDKYSAVAILNSRLCDKMETTTSKAIVSMNANNTATTLQYWFYNNTKSDGETAFTFTEDISTVTNHVLTAEQAANYIDKSVIFGTTNRGVTYTAAWDPTVTEIQVDNNVYYNFNGNSNPTGTNYAYTYDTSASGNEKITTLGALTIDGTAGKVTARTSDTQINAGGKISVEVAANTSIMISNYSGYHSYKVYGSVDTSERFANADTVSYFFSEAQTVTFEAVSTVYLYQIIIMPDQEAPETATCTSLSVAGVPTTELAVGTELDLSTLSVKANYSDNTYRVLSSSDFTTDASTVVDINTPGEYNVTVTYGTVTSSFKVTYVSEVSNVITENTSLVLGTNNTDLIAAMGGNQIEGKSVQFGKFLLDATSGKIRLNGGDNAQVNTGTKIVFTVAAGATVTVVGYSGNYAYSVNGTEATDAETTITVTEETEITILATDSKYLKQIIITYAE